MIRHLCNLSDPPQLSILILHILRGETEENNLQIIQIWIWIKPSNCLVFHPTDGSLGLSFLSLSTVFFLSLTSTAHSASLIVPDVQPLVNHSRTVPRWPALGRRKHSSHRGVYLFLCKLPYLICIVFHALKRLWSKAGNWRTIPTSIQKIPRLGGPNGENDATLKELSFCKSSSLSLPKANSICQANIIWCGLQPAHLPLPESRPVGSYRSEVLLTDA